LTGSLNVCNLLALFAPHAAVRIEH
jgi:hypothetical protein